VRHRCDSRHLGNEPVGRDPAVFGIKNVESVVVEGRQRPGYPAHDSHRVRIAPETPIDRVDLLVEHRVIGNVRDKLRFLLVRWQLAVEQQPGDLQEIRMLDELVYRITPVEQQAVVSIDKCDRGAADPCRCQPGIKRVSACRLAKSAHVDHVVAQGRVQDGQTHRRTRVRIAQHHRG
jgi:hypothetical protein